MELLLLPVEKGLLDHLYVKYCFTVLSTHVLYTVLINNHNIFCMCSGLGSSVPEIEQV